MVKNCPSKALCYFSILYIFFYATIGFAGDYLLIPQIQGWVTDRANVLSISDRDFISNMLDEYEKETKHQIAVLFIPTLNGKSIESFSLRVANSWKLGHKDIDNGVLVTLAMKEKKVRIELGFGMEKYISSSTAKSIIVNSMVPAFKNGDFSGGLQDGLKLIMKEARNFVIPDINNCNNYNNDS